MAGVRKATKPKIAYGESDIRTDTITFYCDGETLVFPTRLVAGHIAHYGGDRYWAELKDLHDLQKMRAKHGLR